MNIYHSPILNKRYIKSDSNECKFEDGIIYRKIELDIMFGSTDDEIKDIHLVKSVLGECRVIKYDKKRMEAWT